MISIDCVFIDEKWTAKRELAFSHSAPLSILYFGGFLFFFFTKFLKDQKETHSAHLRKTQHKLNWCSLQQTTERLNTQQGCCFFFIPLNLKRWQPSRVWMHKRTHKLLMPTVLIILIGNIKPLVQLKIPTSWSLRLCFQTTDCPQQRGLNGIASDCKLTLSQRNWVQ